MEGYRVDFYSAIWSTIQSTTENQRNTNGSHRNHERGREKEMMMMIMMMMREDYVLPRKKLCFGIPP